MKNFTEIPSTPLYTAELPADPNRQNHPRPVLQACYSHVETHQPSNPELLNVSEELAAELGIDLSDRDTITKVLTGAMPFPDYDAFAMCYGGHQFGHWAGQLGDGRAINIAELQLEKGPMTFQLKGSGPTPYSRGADGFAVLRSSVREYLCSEAMHHLGVPTTRALSLALTGDKVMRDMLYDGNPKNEPGAVVCRVAPSFLRFGSFEIFAARKDEENLKKLVDFTIRNYFPELGTPNKETYLSFYKKVAESTRKMIVHWQRVGFVHGVMNTDNLSILGLTIDYGPYGWLEDYDPEWTPNTTDRQHRRYRFGNQPKIALWNLMQLANALYLLIQEVEPLEAELQAWQRAYKQDYHEMMVGKLGLTGVAVSPDFVKQLTVLLERSELDYTMFFRELSHLTEFDAESTWKLVKSVSYLDDDALAPQQEHWQQWFTEFALLIEASPESNFSRLAAMQAINPKYVLRNYMAQLAIDAAENGDYSVIEELYQMLRKPYHELPEFQKYYAKRPDWAKHKVGCSMLSCSS